MNAGIVDSQFRNLNEDSPANDCTKIRRIIWVEAEQGISLGSFVDKNLAQRAMEKNDPAGHKVILNILCKDQQDLWAECTKDHSECHHGQV